MGMRFIMEKIHGTCDICGKQGTEHASDYAFGYCTCSMNQVELIRLAAWHAAQRDILLAKAKSSTQLELQFETADSFKQAFSKYRDGQRSMLHSIESYVRSIGYDGVAERIRKRFESHKDN